MKIGQSSYAGVESSQWRVVGEDTANRIANLHGLDDSSSPTRAELLEAWVRTPISKFGQDRLEKWRLQNARRSAAKQLPVVKLALAEMLFFCLSYVPAAQLCHCGFDGKLEGSDRSCELCEGLKALGIETFSTREKVIDDLGKLHAKLEGARVAPAAGGAA